MDDDVLYPEEYSEMTLVSVMEERFQFNQCFMNDLPVEQETTRCTYRQVYVDQQDEVVKDSRELENKSLCYLSDEKGSNDDDSDVLIAAFGLEDDNQRKNQTWDQIELRRQKLPHITSPSLRRGCHCSKARYVVSIHEEANARKQEIADPHNASKEYLDMHIRYAVVVRVARVDTIDGKDIFVLKVSDPETKMRWEAKKTLREMMLFYSHIQQISLEKAPVKKAFWGTLRELRRSSLPKKLFASRGSLNTQRRAAFDSFLRQTAALVSPAPLGPRRRKALLLLQAFVDVHRHCNVSNRDACTCFFPQSKVNAPQLVAKIFTAPGHRASRDCHSFVLALTLKSVDVKHTFMTERRARTLLNTIFRKMRDVKDAMLKDEVLLSELAVAHLERSESDYDEFLDEVKHAVCGFVQKNVLVPLEDHVYEALTRLMDEKDENRSGSDWENARRELRRVNEYTLPLDKLKCLARAAGAIFQSCGSSWSSSSVDTTSSFASVEEVNMVLRPSMTTDEFISVHLFVLVMSNMSHLLITREFLRVTCDPQDTSGELGYYLTTFEVAVDLLINHADPQQPMLL
ncbi:unnamed protein product [Peronospora belbahrii]|uniref:VPS9 domain-containing protein n=1 Tax=Peronospora belbahrii TaxID=622444 RepID=A0AAU9KND3_9STRA|nr:unnamed protein product [Peronospora belbahrii]